MKCFISYTYMVLNTAYLIQDKRYTNPCLASGRLFIVLPSGYHTVFRRFLTLHERILTRLCSFSLLNSAS